MKRKVLDKIATLLYPDLPAVCIPHSLLQLVNIHTFKSNTEALRNALFPGGSIIHILSGSAFFTLGPWHALARVRSEDRPIRGVVVDSVPYDRIEARLLQVAGLPLPLCAPIGAVARVALQSPLFGATREYTDRYNAAQRHPATFAPVPHVLVAHSVDDAVIPVREFRTWHADVRARSDWLHAGDNAAGGDGGAGPARPRLETYEGVGMHACLARDDPNFVAAVRAWRTTIGMPQA